MTQQQNLPALPDGFQTGLEAFEQSDAVIPRLNIRQKEGLFEDNLSGETFEVVKMIPLGLVKQRVLWPATKDESNDAPMCKSPNNQIGFPNDDAPKDKRFPWAKSGFDKDSYPEQADGLRELPCAACQLKEWGSHPNGKSPWCTEQWTLPVLYDGHDDGTFAPAIFMLQRSGLKAIKAYLTPFQRNNSPAFVNVATVRLEIHTRGDVVYSKPKFTRSDPTAQAEWPSFAMQFMQIKEYLERRPVGDEEEEVTQAGANNANTAPPQAQQAPPQQPVQQVPEQDPWTGDPVQPEQPAAPPVQQPVQTQPQVQPVQQVQPAQQPVQTQPQVQPVQPVQQAAPPAPSAPAAPPADDDDIPF